MKKRATEHSITGILLAAGSSQRFGKGNKLLYPLEDGTPLAIASARNLSSSLKKIIAVVRPEDKELASLLQQEGIEICSSPESKKGIGASISNGVKNSIHADGWVFALADMPYSNYDVISIIIENLLNNKAIVRPYYQNKPGHPVGFGQVYRNELINLNNKEGAISIINKNPSQLQKIILDNPSIIKDFDTLEDFIQTSDKAI